MVKIIGRYLETENDVKYEGVGSLGKVRAIAIQQLLTDRGLSEDIILIEDEVVSEEKLDQPIVFEFIKKETTE